MSSLLLFLVPNLSTISTPHFQNCTTFSLILKHTCTLFNRRSVNNNQLEPRLPSIYIRKFALLCFTLVKLRCIKCRTRTVCFSASHSSRCHPTLPSKTTTNSTKKEVIVRSTKLNRLDCEQRTSPGVICSSHGVMNQGKVCAKLIV